MKLLKKKNIMHRLTKVGSDIQKIQHFAGILKKAGILTGLATFAGGIATGGVGIAVVTVGVAGLALSKILKKKKGSKHHELTDEQKEILTTLIEKLIKDDANDSTHCDNTDDKRTDKDKEKLEIILNILKYKNSASNDQEEHKDNDKEKVKDDGKGKEKDNDKSKDKTDDKNKDNEEELLEVILTLLKNKNKKTEKI